MTRLSNTLTDIANCFRLRKRFRRQLLKLDRRVSSLISPGRSIVLIGASRLGKSSIARELELQGVLCHVEVDAYAKLFAKLSSDDLRSSMTDGITHSVVKNFPRGVVIEGAYLSRSFINPRTQGVDWATYLRWTDKLQGLGARIVVIVTEASENDCLDTICRGREAGMCWSASKYREDDLTVLTRLIMRKNASMQEIAAGGRAEVIRMSFSSRNEHVQSIRSAVEKLSQQESAN